FITYKPKQPLKRDFYFVGIGVSDYKDNDYDLKYAAKDIKDMAQALKLRYNNIEIDTLLNENATVDNIMKLQQKLQNTTEDDIVILAFCGHGVLDEEFNWYFATHQMDFKQPKTYGLSYDVLQGLTGSIKARQKLITLDACHSGEIDTEDTEFSENNIASETKVNAYKRGSSALSTKNDSQSTYTLMKQLFSDLESNGTVTISASGGLEYAFESKDYQNGVFT